MCAAIAAFIGIITSGIPLGPVIDPAPADVPPEAEDGLAAAAAGGAAPCAAVTAAIAAASAWCWLAAVVPLAGVVAGAAGRPVPALLGVAAAPAACDAGRGIAAAADAGAGAELVPGAAGAGVPMGAEFAPGSREDSGVLRPPLPTPLSAGADAVRAGGGRGCCECLVRSLVTLLTCLFFITAAPAPRYTAS
jgi:hypothetical protein